MEAGDLEGRGRGRGRRLRRTSREEETRNKEGREAAGRSSIVSGEG